MPGIFLQVEMVLARSRFLLQVDNFFDDDASGECLYIPSGMSPAAGPASGPAATLASLIADMEAELSVSDRMEAAEGGPESLYDGRGVAEIVVEAEADSSDEDEEHSWGDVLQDESLPERFRVALSGFVNGVGDAGAAADNGTENDDAVVEYVDMPGEP